MTRCSTMLAAIALLVTPVVLLAQDMFANVEYLAGKTGWKDKRKGTLLISDAEVRFVSEKGELLFAVPMASIRDVSNSLDRQDPGLGKKLAFGMFAKSSKQEVVVISTATTNDAEAIVFKINEKNTAPAIVAKIKFRMEKAAKPGGPETPRVRETLPPPRLSRTP